MARKLPQICLTALSILSAVLPIAQPAIRAEEGPPVTGTFSVEARVRSACSIFQPEPELRFGTVDLFTGPDTVTSETTLTFVCTAGTSFRITLGRGNHYGIGGNLNSMKHRSADRYIRYVLGATPNSGTGQGPAAQIQSVITGTTWKSFFGNIPAGDYDDTVLVTLEAD